MKSTLLSLSWIAVCAAIVGLFFGIDLDLNFFNWSGAWHLQSVACLVGVLILMGGIIFLAFATDSRAVSIVGAISSLLLIGVGIYGAQPEPLGNPGQWLTRNTPSPLWYRWGRLALACMPLCILMVVALINRLRPDPIKPKV